MKLDAARKLAEKSKKEFLGPWYKCLFRSCGLIVLVVRKHDGEMVEGAVVSVTGETTYTAPDGQFGMGREETLPFHEMTGTTDRDGVTSFLPFYEGRFRPSVASIPDRDRVAHKLGYDFAVVTTGSCPICVLEVELWARPEVVVKRRHDDGAFDEVGVNMSSYAFPQKTQGGLSAWTDKPIPPRDYEVALTFPGPHRYRLFDEQNAVIAGTPRVTLPIGKHRFVFKAARLSWVKFLVHEVKPNATVELPRATATVTWPEDRGTRTFETANGAKEIPDIARVNGDATRLEVTLLEAPDDGDPEVYEFVRMTTA